MASVELGARSRITAVAPVGRSHSTCCEPAHWCARVWVALAGRAEFGSTIVSLPFPVHSRMKPSSSTVSSRGETRSVHLRVVELAGSSHNSELPLLQIVVIASVCVAENRHRRAASVSVVVRERDMLVLACPYFSTVNRTLARGWPSPIWDRVAIYSPEGQFVVGRVT